jgi:hypothetical protein
MNRRVESTFAESWRVFCNQTAMPTRTIENWLDGRNGGLQ